MGSWPIRAIHAAAAESGGAAPATATGLRKQIRSAGRSVAAPPTTTRSAALHPSPEGLCAARAGARDQCR